MKGKRVKENICMLNIAQLANCSFFLLTAREICHLRNTNETPNMHILSSERFPSTSTNPSGI